MVASQSPARFGDLVASLHARLVEQLGDDSCGGFAIHYGMPPTDTEKLLQTLADDGVVDLANARAALASTPDDADVATCVAVLVERGVLTAYQAACAVGEEDTRLSVGDYIILDKIGEGGMGSVYRARHLIMDRVVALKLMRAAAAARTDIVKRFLREVKAAAKLSHPNIVTAYDAGIVDGLPYLAMEYVDGSDVSAAMRGRGSAFDVPTAISITVQTARGLAYAHNHGVIHRDIKPGNLLWNSAGVIKILDMGLARIEAEVAGDSSQLTMTDSPMGTAAYMSPEQAMDAKSVDHRTDIYALGCTMFRLIADRHIYVRDTPMKVIMSQVSDPIPALPDHCPPALQAVFEKMVAKSPDARFGSCDEVIAALTDAVPNVATPAPVTSQPTPPPASSGGLPEQSAVTVELEESETRSPLPPALLTDTDAVADANTDAGGDAVGPMRRVLLAGATAGAIAAAVIGWSIFGPDAPPDDSAAPTSASGDINIDTADPSDRRGAPVTPVTPVAPVTATGAAGGLVAHWPFDDHLRDASGNGHHGVLQGHHPGQAAPDAASYTDGVRGRAIDLDGRYYVEVPVDAAFNWKRDWSVATWIRMEPNVYQRNFMPIVSHRRDRSWRLSLSGESISRPYGFHLTYGPGRDGPMADDPSSDYRDGRWHHVVAMRRGEDYLIYVDGKVTDRRRATPDRNTLPDYSESGPVHIGFNFQVTNSNGRHLVAHIDDVRLYDRALTDEEVAGLAAPEAQREWVDLIGEVGAKTIMGAWQIEGGHARASGQAHLNFEAEPPSDYDVDVTFIRRRVSGNDSAFSVMFPVGDTSLRLNLDAFGVQASGVENIDGSKDNETVTRDFRVVSLSLHRVAIRVRLLEPDMARIEADVDGKPLVRWEGERTRLSPHHPAAVARRIGVIVRGGDFELHEARLRPIRGDLKIIGRRE